MIYTYTWFTCHIYDYWHLHTHHWKSHEDVNMRFLKNNKKFISKGLLILSIDVIVNDFSIGEKWFI